MVKLCVDKLCVSKLCVSKLRVSKLCVDKLYVMSGRAAGGREKAGVQNQKQEPHTKMWGMMDFAGSLVGKTLTYGLARC